MSVIDTILICLFVLGMTVFCICAGIAIVWTFIEDTALGRAIDEIMDEKIERWKRGKID